ncbi:hypothetical protein ABVT39_015600 [Epinephelus coioides]
MHPDNREFLLAGWWQSPSGISLAPVHTDTLDLTFFRWWYSVGRPSEFPRYSFSRFSLCPELEDSHTSEAMYCVVEFPEAQVFAIVPQEMSLPSPGLTSNSVTGPVLQQSPTAVD